MVLDEDSYVGQLGDITSFVSWYAIITSHCNGAGSQPESTPAFDKDHGTWSETEKNRLSLQ